MSAAASLPARWAWRPFSSGNASKIPKVAGAMRRANQAGVAASSSTSDNPSLSSWASSSSFPRFASRRTSNPTVTARSPTSMTTPPSRSTSPSRSSSITPWPERTVRCASAENSATVAFLNDAHDLQISDVPVPRNCHVHCSSERAIALRQLADRRQQSGDGTVSQRAPAVLAVANNRDQTWLRDDHEHVGDTATRDLCWHVDTDRHAQMGRDRDRLHPARRVRAADRVRHNRANGAPIAADALAHAINDQLRRIDGTRSKYTVVVFRLPARELR